MADDIMPMPMEGGSSFRMPKSIIDAVSDIQQYAVMESEGISDIPESFFTIRRRLAYMNLGFIYGLGDNLLVWIISPFLYGVLFNYISIFGHDSLTLFDKIFVLILSKYITMGLLSLMVFLLFKGKGTLSRGCTSAIISGYAAALLTRMAVFLFAYRSLYIAWPNICRWLYNFGAGFDPFGSYFHFLHPLSSYITCTAAKFLNMRHILLITSNYETVFSCVMLIVLAVMYMATTIIWKRSTNPYYGRF